MPSPLVTGEQIALALAAELGWSGHVEDLQPLSGGASRQTWSCDFRSSLGAVVPLIVRRNPPWAASAPMILEGDAIRGAAGNEVPVPTIYVCVDDPTLLGAPAMIMRRVDGEALPKRVLAGVDDRAALTAELGAALAGVHRIDPAAIRGLTAGLDVLDRIERTLTQAEVSYPVLSLTLAWLREHRPPAVGPVVLHGDFRMGNLLIEGSRLQAVLDWELVHLGDPHEDLAWLCTKAWRFGGAGEVAGFGDVGSLLESYRACGGQEIDPQALRWWQVASTVKWAVMCIEQSDLYRSGAETSIELLSLGRRISECEADLVADLADLEPTLSVPVSAGLASNAVPWPDTIAIVQAVRKLLSAELREATTGRSRYLARVGANLLGMVERELTAEEAAVDGRTSTMGAANLEAIAQDINRRLAIDHPGYHAG